MNSLKLALALGAFTLCGASASLGAVVYTQTSNTGFTTSTATVSSVLEDVNFAATTVQPQVLSGMTLGYGALPGTTAQTGAVFVDFYDTINTASTGSVVSNYLGGFGATLNITANAGTTTALRASSFSNLNTLLTTPINFTDNSVGVIVTFTDSTGGFYSTVLTPLMNVPGTPTVGTSLAGAYRDTNGDGTFQATEFNATAGNYYLSITTVAVPEPTTFALIGSFGVAGLLVYRRKREATV